MTSQPRRPLSRDRILDAALRAGDELGLAGMSMRNIARELGVDAMSLYNHVPNKAALVAGILERSFTEFELPERTQPWAERLRSVGREMYRVFAAHPVLVALITTGVAQPTSVQALRPIDELFAALYDAGFDDRAATQGAAAVSALVFGSVQLRPARASDAGSDERDAIRRSVAAGRLDHLDRAIRAARPPDPVADFGHQLDLLVDGLELRAANTRG